VVFGPALAGLPDACSLVLVEALVVRFFFRLPVLVLSVPGLSCLSALYFLGCICSLLTQ
jgi:hypothetical protein